MKEFKVNKFITLRLVNGETNIYIKGTFFNQCLSSLSENKNKKIQKSPETEFWEHCSNLRIWSEKGYNTNLLSHSLAFPLLEKLVEAGDSIAKKVFKKEIAKKIKSGYWSIVEYLVMEGFIKYLNQGDFDALGSSIQRVEVNGRTFYAVGGVLDLSYVDCRAPKRLDNLKNIGEIKGLDQLIQLKVLNLEGNNITSINNLKSLTNLEKLNLNQNKITEIKNLDSLTNLKELYLSRNNIEEIKGLNQLINLRLLDLSWNSIFEINGLGSLEKIEELYLSNNRIKKINHLDKLINLRHLDLESNKISRIEGLGMLTKLEDLSLMDNNYMTITELDNLKSLKYLKIDLMGSKLEGFQNFENLQELIVFYDKAFEPILDKLGGCYDIYYQDFGRYTGTVEDPQSIVKYCKNVEKVPRDLF